MSRWDHFDASPKPKVWRVPAQGPPARTADRLRHRSGLQGARGPLSSILGGHSAGPGWVSGSWSLTTTHGLPPGVPRRHCWRVPTCLAQCLRAATSWPMACAKPRGL